MVFVVVPVAIVVVIVLVDCVSVAAFARIFVVALVSIIVLIFNMEFHCCDVFVALLFDNKSTGTFLQLDCKDAVAPLHRYTNIRSAEAINGLG